MIAHPDPVPGRSTSSSPPARQLWPADMARLQLNEHSRLDEANAAALVVESPGSSFWIPETGEFLIVTPWRHRSDIVTIHTSGAFAHEAVLMEAVIEHAAGAGHAALVVVDINESRHPAFYARHGLMKLEDIVTYEHRQPAQLGTTEHREVLDFRQVTPADGATRSILLDLDHEAFPWLWRNSPSEFESYLRFPGVEVWIGYSGGEAVCYAGFTHYHRWGHLDRIATVPDHQGKGFGRQMLRMAVQRMVARGAYRVALSTQGVNAPSRKLYADAGFSRTPEDDYAIFAAVFGAQRRETPDQEHVTVTL